MVIGRHRNTRAIISLEAIKHNVATQISKLKDGQSLFAVVKANAYGHGMIPVAKAAKEAGANGFCVAIIDEGIALRESGIKDPILIRMFFNKINSFFQIFSISKANSSHTCV